MMTQENYAPGKSGRFIYRVVSHLNATEPHFSCAIIVWNKILLG